MTLEEVMIKMGIDTSSIAKGLRSVEQKVEEFAHGVAHRMKDAMKDLAAPLIGFFAVDKIKDSIKEVAEMGKAIKRGAEDTGTSIQFFQGFTKALQQLHVGSEQSTASLKILSQKIGEARSGSDEAQKMFKKWGIDLSGSNDQIIYQITEKFHTLGSTNLRNAMAFEMMGKNSKSMGSSLALGAEGLRKLIDESKRLTDTQVDQLAELDLKLEQLGRKWKRYFAIAVTAGMGTTAPAGVTDAQVFEKMKTIGKGQGLDAEKLYQTAYGFQRFLPGGAWAKSQLNDLREQAIQEFHHNESMEKIRAESEEKTQEASTAAAEKKKKIHDHLTKAWEIEGANDRKKLTLEEQIHSLEVDRGKLLAFSADKKNDELEQAKALEEFAKVDVEMRKTQHELEVKKSKEAKEQKTHAKEQKKLNEEMADAQLRLSREKSKEQVQGLVNLVGPYLPTIQELAQSGRWGRRGNRDIFQQGPFARTAQEMLRLQADAKDAAIWGNTDRVKRDADRIDSLRKTLVAAGIQTPDMRLESIQEATEDTAKHLKRLIDKEASILVKPDDSEE